jgi:inosine/xanthosine triphosphatase
VLFALGSRNPVKAAALRAGLAPFFADAEVEAVEAPSGVAAQPRGDEETQRGAVQRAQAALAIVPDAEYGVGLEGGVMEIGGVMYAYAWCAIVARRGSQQGLASTGRCPLPPAVAELVRQGLELGPADDRVFGRHNSRLKEGAVGLLTRGHIDRAAFYTPAVIMALAPFLNPDHFPAS